MAVWFGYHFYYKWEAGFGANAHAFIARGFPGVFGYFDMLAEIVVIPFLVLGVYSRFCMLLLTPLMLGAVGVFWSRDFNFTFAGWELPALWLLVMWVLILIGDGRYALRLPHLPLDGRHPATYWGSKGIKSMRHIISTFITTLLSVPAFAQGTMGAGSQTVTLTLASINQPLEPIWYYIIYLVFAAVIVFLGGVSVVAVRHKSWRFQHWSTAGGGSSNK